MYLINKDHKNIALILGDANDMGVSLLRLERYKKVLDQEGIYEDNGLILIGQYSSLYL